MYIKPRIPILPIIAFVATIGCRDDASHVAREAADRQAQQNTAMADLNKEVAGGSHQLVAADAQARQEIVGVHHDLQEERARLDAGWSALETERQQVARERRTESLLVVVAPAVGSALALMLALGFCWWMLVSATSGDQVDARLNEVLMAEVLVDEPVLLASERIEPRHEPLG